MSNTPEYPNIDHCPITLGDEDTLQRLNIAHQADLLWVADTGCEIDQRFFAGPIETKIHDVHSAMLDGYREVLRQFDLAKALYENVAPGFVTELERKASTFKKKWIPLYDMARDKVQYTGASKLIDFLDNHRPKLVVSDDPNISDNNHLSRWLFRHYDITSSAVPSPNEAQAVLDFAFSQRHITRYTYTLLHNLIMGSDYVNNHFGDPISMSHKERMSLVEYNFSTVVNEDRSKEPGPELSRDFFDLIYGSKEVPDTTLVNLSILRPGDIVLMEGYIVNNNTEPVKRTYYLRIEPDRSVKCWFISTTTDVTPEDHANVPAICLPTSAFIAPLDNPTKESRTAKGILSSGRSVIMPGLNKDKSHISLDITATDVVGIVKMVVIYHHLIDSVR